MQRDGWQSKQTRPHKDSGTSQLGDEYFAMVVKAGNVGFDTQLDAKPRKEKEELIGKIYSGFWVKP